MPRSAEVSGEVTFTVESPDGSTSGRISGRGNRLQVTADDAAVAFRNASAPGGRRPALGGLGDRLAEAGLVLEVAGPDGALATLGDGVDSRLGRLTAGSRRVQPGRVRAVRPLVAVRLREVTTTAGRRVAPLLLAGGAVAVVVAARRAAARH